MLAAIAAKARRNSRCVELRLLLRRGAASFVVRLKRLAPTRRRGAGSGAIWKSASSREDRREVAGAAGGIRRSGDGLRGGAGGMAALAPGLYQVGRVWARYVARADSGSHAVPAPREEAVHRGRDTCCATAGRTGHRNTYMAADAQRKFLLEPNPALWDRDFAQMNAPESTWCGPASGRLETDHARSRPRRRGVPSGARRVSPGRAAARDRGHLQPVRVPAGDVGGENPTSIPVPSLPRKSSCSNSPTAPAAPTISPGPDQRAFVLLPAHLFSCRPNYDQHERRRGGNG